MRLFQSGILNTFSLGTLKPLNLSTVNKVHQVWCQNNKIQGGKKKQKGSIYYNLVTSSFFPLILSDQRIPFFLKPREKISHQFGTPRKFNSSPLKNGGWKTILSYWVLVTFQGRARRAVKLREGNWKIGGNMSTAWAPPQLDPVDLKTIMLRVAYGCFGRKGINAREHNMYYPEKLTWQMENPPFEDVFVYWKWGWSAVMLDVGSVTCIYYKQLRNHRPFQCDWYNSNHEHSLDISSYSNVVSKYRSYPPPNHFSNGKVDGTVPTYWFQPTFWYLCHLFWP